MDGPTDKSSGLLRLITDGPTDKSSGLRIRILRTPDPGPFFDGPPVLILLTTGSKKISIANDKRSFLTDFSLCQNLQNDYSLSTE